MCVRLTWFRHSSHNAQKLNFNRLDIWNWNIKNWSRLCSVSKLSNNFTLNEITSQQSLSTLISIIITSKRYSPSGIFKWCPESLRVVPRNLMKLKKAPAESLHLILVFFSFVYWRNSNYKLISETLLLCLLLLLRFWRREEEKQFVCRLNKEKIQELFPLKK